MDARAHGRTDTDARTRTHARTHARTQAWAKPLAGGATAALLLNRNASGPVNATVHFGACNVSAAATVVTDLWSGALLAPGSHRAGWSAGVAPHAHRLVKFSRPHNG